MRLKLAGLLFGLIASPVAAQICVDRPGLGIAVCTIDPGHLQVEAGIGDWTHDKQPDSITNNVTAADIALRLGVGSSTELRLDWPSYNYTRSKDRMTGAVDSVSGVGDVTLGIKQRLTAAHGAIFTVALVPYVTLPAGKEGSGAGDWAAGLLVPMGYKLSEMFKLEFMPEIDAAVDEDGRGRHLVYSGVFGLQAKPSDKITLSIEFQTIRDRDPDQHLTETLAAFSMGYLAAKHVQLDIQANAGLNHNAPDVELLFGVSEKF